jgi:hypothetical protein
MRLVTVVVLSIAAMGSSVSASKSAPAPFEGSWLRCDSNAGYRLCSYARTTQRGKRVCGVEGYVATNSVYQTRFVGTAEGISVRIDKICGRPGSETDTHCGDQASRDPGPGEKVGWGTSRNIFHVCKDRLHSRPGDQPFDCATAIRDAGMTKVRRLPKGDGPDEIERAWLVSCTAGRE